MKQDMFTVNVIVVLEGGAHSVSEDSNASYRRDGSVRM
jgi:hypothetical protein